MRACLFSLFDESPTEVVVYRGVPLNTIGTYPVFLPDAVELPSPATPATVLTALQNYYLDSNSLFTYQEFGSDYTPTDWDLTGSIASSVGSLGSTFLWRSTTPTPQLVSTLRALAITPGQALLQVNLLTHTDSDPLSGLYSRLTEPRTPAGVLCEVSFNGGVTFVTAVPEEIFSIPVLDQGNSLVVKFSRTSGTDKAYVSSWSLLY